MDTFKYKAFLKVAETGSMGKAAEKLNYTQPAITYIIRSLEKELGTQLMSRAYNGVSLTQAGNEILPIAKRLLECESDLESKMSELKLQGVIS